MAAPKPTFRTELPPPSLPAIQGMSDQLANYLRTFSLWCRHGFADKLSGTVAQPGIMIQATDATTGKPTPYSYLVGVKVTVTGGVPSAPAMTFTLIPTGSGSP
jgi:hypothetical protein